MNASKTMRINRWFSERGVCSRKQADRLIHAGRVCVNGQTAVVGMLISDADQVTLDEQLIGDKPQPTFILYHKPVGVVCTHSPAVENNIEHALGIQERVFALGRLDKESEGLILLSNQGDLVNQIMHSANKKPKVYHVWLDRAINEGFIESMSSGVEILGTTTLPCEVEKLDDTHFQITLTQGLNRQIRRMCKALGYRVIRLKRIQIMNFTLEGLKLNEHRKLSQEEIDNLRAEISVHP